MQKIFLCKNSCCPNCYIEDGKVVIDDDNGGVSKISFENMNTLVDLWTSGELKRFLDRKET